MMLSLVIPLYNVEKYISKCLDSCINQVNTVLGKDYEIIIVNDGSPDNSAEIALEIITNKPGCRLINQANKGLGGARNTGLGHAAGEYIWFIDSDDWISHGSINVLIRSIIEFGFPDMINFRAANIINQSVIIREESIGKTPLLTDGRKVFISRKWETCIPFNCYRKRFLIENNLKFVERIFHEDNEFTPRLLWHADKVLRIDDVLYFVRQNPQSITRTPNIKRAFDLIFVCKSLSDFYNQTINNEQFCIILHKFIASTLNSAFHIILSADKDTRKQFEKELANEFYILMHLKKSRDTEYFIEYILFKLHPLLPFVTSFSFLKSMKYRSN